MARGREAVQHPEAQEPLGWANTVSDHPQGPGVGLPTLVLPGLAHGNIRHPSLGQAHEPFAEAGVHPPPEKRIRGGSPEEVLPSFNGWPVLSPEIRAARASGSRSCFGQGPFVSREVGVGRSAPIASSRFLLVFRRSAASPGEGTPRRSPRCAVGVGSIFRTTAKLVAVLLGPPAIRAFIAI